MENGPDSQEADLRDMDKDANLLDRDLQRASLNWNEMQECRSTVHLSFKHAITDFLFYFLHHGNMLLT